MPSILNHQPLPHGSSILVTGGHDLAASHIANEALAAGFKVRGTVRSVIKTAWMISMFNAKVGLGNFELTEAANITADGAFESAMAGVFGVAQIAVLLDPVDPNVMLVDSVTADLSVLKSAAKQETVKAPC